MEEQVKILVAKALDCVRISNNKNIPKFVGFLSPAEATVVSKNVGNGPNYFFYGGYENAERRIFGVLPDYALGDFSYFPIKVLEIEYNSSFTLSHRDILGTLMSTGVNRVTIGDILILSGKAYVFVLEDMADYFVNQIDKIKNIGVNIKAIEELSSLEFVSAVKTAPVTFTVSSPRLDAVVSGLTGVARGSAEKLINDGLVFVNSFEVTKCTKKVQMGDVITVRKFGRFKITSAGSFSKKGREIISADKYI